MFARATIAIPYEVQPAEFGGGDRDDEARQDDVILRIDGIPGLPLLRSVNGIRVAGA